MTTTVQIQSKGGITLPIALREKYKLEKGKSLSKLPAYTTPLKSQGRF
jgi:bifunctional DNA-binding transcriptional regulator/antitoxin component of YhaV-PrlF toxin-antitoxin module